MIRAWKRHVETTEPLRHKLTLTLVPEGKCLIQKGLNGGWGCCVIGRYLGV